MFSVKGDIVQAIKTVLTIFEEGYSLCAVFAACLLQICPSVHENKLLKALCLLTVFCNHSHKYLQSILPVSKIMGREDVRKQEIKLHETQAAVFRQVTSESQFPVVKQNLNDAFTI